MGEGRWALGPSVGVSSADQWKNGTCSVGSRTWHTMMLNVTGGLAYGWLDGNLLFAVGLAKAGVDLSARGWVGIGAGAYSGVQFDRFTMQQ